jgi:uncharacterized membrane protein YgaE (UPF0421/DUF939 family)
MRAAWRLTAGRLRAAALPLLHAAAAAALAWFLVADLLGHKRGIFAPIAALLVLSRAPGRRARRVVETVIGAALGVGVGDVVIGAIGAGPLQVGLVALLAMAAATAIGAGPAVVTQAGTASVLIATIQPPTGLYSALAAQRFVDVLIGGGVGLAIALALPRNPLSSTREAAAPLCAGLEGTLEEIAAGLERRDAATAERALERARSLDARARALQQALELAEETARLAPAQWHTRAEVARRVAAAAQLELAVRDVRVLARSALRAVELEQALPAELARAVRELASAADGARSAFGDGDAGAGASDAALRAAGRATRVVETGGSMAVSAVVAQVRSTATDLLSALGLSHAEAVERVRGAAQALFPRGPGGGPSAP